MKRKLSVVISEKLFGAWTFKYKGKEGLIFFAPDGSNAHIHYGYDEERDEPEQYGDYDNLTKALLSFRIDHIPLAELLDEIVCEAIIYGKTV